jgi:membrane protein
MSVSTARRRAVAWATLWRGRAERLPVIGNIITEWYRIEVVDRAMAIGAQGLLAVLPMLVVLAAILPHDAATTLYVEVSDTMGLKPSDSQPLGTLMTGGEGTANAGWIGLLIALISATSFARALQRMYARAFDLPWEGRHGKIRASTIWLFTWLSFLAFLAWFGGHTGDLPFAPAIIVSTVLQAGFWWWSLHFLLLGDCGWSDLLPTALLATVAISLVVRGSDLVMPVYTRSMTSQYGAFGLILALATWMVVMAGVLVLTAAAGALITQTPYWQALAVRLGLPGARSE